MNFPPLGELTERERSLCAWALRCQTSKPEFVNARMKRECNDLAEMLEPTSLQEESCAGGEGP